MNKVTLSREPVVKTIPMSEMKVGTFAEIVTADCLNKLGNIVFRDEFSVGIVGATERLVEYAGTPHNCIKVRTLEKGETITITIGEGE